jgi:hypothetical protein
MSEWGIARVPNLDQLRPLDEIERRLGALEAGAVRVWVWRRSPRPKRMARRPPRAFPAARPALTM